MDGRDEDDVPADQRNDRTAGDLGDRDDAPPAARRAPGERARSAEGAGDRLAARGRRRIDKGRLAFDTGNVLAKTFSIWFRNIIPFTILSAIVQVPMIGWALAVTQASDPIAAAWLGLGAIPLGIVLGQVVTATLIYGVFQQLRRGRAPIGRCLSVALSRLLPVIGVALLVAVLYVLPFVPAFGFGVAMVVSGPTPDRVAPAALLALIGLVPFIVIAAGLVAALPSVVVERTGVVGALRRSWALARGSKLQIVLVFIVVAIVFGAVGCIFKAPTLGTRDHPAEVPLDLIKDILLAPLQAVMAAVIYHDLRVAKEGIASEELAAIFD